MDIKERIEEVVAKLKADPTLMSDFQKDPVKTVEKITGIDIPDGVENQLVSGVKSALAGGGVAGAVDAIKKLF